MRKWLPSIEINGSVFAGKKKLIIKQRGPLVGSWFVIESDVLIVVLDQVNCCAKMIGMMVLNVSVLLWKKINKQIKKGSFGTTIYHAILS